MLIKELVEKRIGEIRTHAFYQPMIQRVREGLEKLMESPIVSLRFHDYNRFFKNGDRRIFETVYFSRRGRLNGCALLYLLTEEEKYKTELEDTIWAICDEYTWAVPAHIEENAPMEEQQLWIDLFAAETGFALSEIHSILGDRLNPKVSARLVYEVRRRIIASYLNGRKYSWETCTNNWAAVCGGSVGNAFLYLGTKEEIDQALPRIFASMESFLSGIPEDGCCLEGVGYWNYGFGFYLHFADHLKDYTNGAINLLNKDVVRAAAKFQQKILLGDKTCVSFSDGNSDFLCQIGISHYLYKNFEGIALPDSGRMRLFGDDNCYRWGTFIRDFVWSDPALAQSSLPVESACFEKAQWFIRREQSYALAAKCGYNSEPHNHNDVGSFMLCMGDVKILDDFGAGEYDAAYFNSPNQYDIFVKSSRSHNLPIVNGAYQKYGAQYQGTVLKQEENLLSMDIAGAYGQDGLDSLVRTFCFSEDRVSVRDEFCFSRQPGEVTERFVTALKPEAGKDRVKIGACELCFDPAAVRCTIGQETYINHGGQPALAYLIDFEKRDQEQKFALEFCMKCC